MSESSCSAPSSTSSKSEWTDDNSRIQRFFGKHAFNWSRINSYKQGIKERLEIEGKDFRGPEDLKVFGQRRGNNIQLTAPRPITVRDPQSDLQQLFEEVVGDRKRSQDVKGFRCRFVEKLTRANLGSKLKWDIADPSPQPQQGNRCPLRLPERSIQPDPAGQLPGRATPPNCDGSPALTPLTESPSTRIPTTSSESSNWSSSGISAPM